MTVMIEVVRDDLVYPVASGMPNSLHNEVLSILTASHSMTAIGW